MTLVVQPHEGILRGGLRVPGDKSISHRAVLFSAMAEGTSALTGVLDSADVRATIDTVRALGVHVVVEPGVRGLTVTVTGWGERGPSSPGAPLDCGNSGTTARLLLGVLAGWDVRATLVGDESLSMRPMSRVTEPLAQMGATFESAEGARLPVSVTGISRLRPIEYDLPMASAQVKTAVLLAGLQATGRTTVREPAPSRDHTEKLLPAFGVPVGREPLMMTAWVDGPAIPKATELGIPADPSSAAFPTVAALMMSGSAVALTDVALNHTRTGFVRVLARMGASVTPSPLAMAGEETVGHIIVRAGEPLHGTVVTAGEVPSLIDEIPILAVAATAAEGTTRFEGVGELRVKESDRLAAIVAGLTAMGATVRAGEDWLEVEGPVKLHGAELDSLGDHRLAMAYYVAGLAASEPVEIDRFEAVNVSYPTFVEDMTGLMMEASEE